MEQITAVEQKLSREEKECIRLTSQNHRVLAEYMGAVYDGRKYIVFPDGRHVVAGDIYKSDLRYESSWDEILPVVKKLSAQVEKLKEIETASSIGVSDFDYTKRDYLCLILERISWITKHFSVQSTYKMVLESLIWLKSRA